MAQCFYLDADRLPDQVTYFHDDGPCTWSRTWTLWYSSPNPCRYEFDRVNARAYSRDGVVMRVSLDDGQARVTAAGKLP